MKKTIALVALMASATTVLAMPGPRTQPKVKMCIQLYSAQDKSLVAKNCDESDNNAKLNLKINDNGCAKDQAAISSTDKLNIPKCMPAGMIQL